MLRNQMHVLESLITKLSWESDADIGILLGINVNLKQKYF